MHFFGNCIKDNSVFCGLNVFFGLNDKLAKCIMRIHTLKKYGKIEGGLLKK